MTVASIVRTYSSLLCIYTWLTKDIICSERLITSLTLLVLLEHARYDCGCIYKRNVKTAYAYS